MTNEILGSDIITLFDGHVIMLRTPNGSLNKIRIKKKLTIYYRSAFRLLLTDIVLN
jgi:hypothetical protein